MKCCEYGTRSQNQQFLTTSLSNFSSLSSRDVTTLADDEALILSLFGKGDLDVGKSTVEFDLAAKMGQVSIL